MLRLEPIDGEGGRLTVETTPRQTATLFQRLGDWMGGEVAAPDGFDVTRARLSVCFMAARGTRPGRSCTFELAEPNGCTLKDHKSAERLILEKYLEKWNRWFQPRRMMPTIRDNCGRVEDTASNRRADARPDVGHGAAARVRG